MIKSVTTCTRSSGYMFFFIMPPCCIKTPSLIKLEVTDVSYRDSSFLFVNKSPDGYPIWFSCRHKSYSL